jgi:tetratricopeptide (TPR) repeat protein
MQSHRNISLCMVVTLAIGLFLPPLAGADNISPHVGSGDREYSKEKRDTSFFGTGPTGALSEASYLRFQGMADLEDQRYDDAIAKLGKALRLDPGDPDTHVSYARALTGKFYAQHEKTIDEKLLNRCIDEWKLIWHYDADASNQIEAKFACRRLVKISKALKKEKEDKATGLVADAAKKTDKEKQESQE